MGSKLFKVGRLLSCFFFFIPYHNLRFFVLFSNFVSNGRYASHPTFFIHPNVDRSICLMFYFQKEEQVQHLSGLERSHRIEPAITRVRQLNSPFYSRLPQNARSYCQGLLERIPVAIKLTHSRSTKWGDYRFGPRVESRISLNHDLPEPFFLLTFIHEYAHHIVHLKYGRKVMPHGKEWKHTFRELMLPLLVPEVYDEEILPVLTRHMANPKANATSDQHLHRIAQERMGIDQTRVEELSSGSEFTFRKRHYRVVGKVRKRIMCERLEDRRRFLFQPNTPIDSFSRN